MSFGNDCYESNISTKRMNTKWWCENSELVFVLLYLSFGVHPIEEELGKANSGRVTLDGSFSSLGFLLFLFLFLLVLMGIK